MMPTSTGNKHRDFTLLLSRVTESINTNGDYKPIQNSLTRIPLSMSSLAFSLMQNPELQPFYQLILDLTSSAAFPANVTELSNSATCLQRVSNKQA